MKLIRYFLNEDFENIKKAGLDIDVCFFYKIVILFFPYFSLFIFISERANVAISMHDFNSLNAGKSTYFNN